MKNVLKNQKGVTLIETLAASVIIVLLLGTLLSALVFGQKVIVGSDEKTRAAAEAQEIIDSLMEDLSKKKDPLSKLISDAENRRLNSDGTENKQPIFAKPKESNSPKNSDILLRQYYILPRNEGVPPKFVAYNIYVRVYYNQGEAYVDLTAFVKKGGVGD